MSSSVRNHVLTAVTTVLATWWAVSPAKTQPIVTPSPQSTTTTADVLARLDRIEARLAALEKAPAPTPTPVPVPPPVPVTSSYPEIVTAQTRYMNSHAGLFAHLAEHPEASYADTILVFRSANKTLGAILDKAIEARINPVVVADKVTDSNVAARIQKSLAEGAAASALVKGAAKR